jgi:hypothetical protein
MQAPEFARPDFLKKTSEKPIPSGSKAPLKSVASFKLPIQRFQTALKMRSKKLPQLVQRRFGSLQGVSRKVNRLAQNILQLRAKPVLLSPKQAGKSSKSNWGSIDMVLPTGGGESPSRSISEPGLGFSLSSGQSIPSFSLPPDSGPSLFSSTRTESKPEKPKWKPPEPGSRRFSRIEEVRAQDLSTPSTVETGGQSQLIQRKPAAPPPGKAKSEIQPGQAKTVSGSEGPQVLPGRLQASTSPTRPETPKLTVPTVPKAQEAPLRSRPSSPVQASPQLSSQGQTEAKPQVAAELKPGSSSQGPVSSLESKPSLPANLRSSEKLPLLSEDSLPKSGQTEIKASNLPKENAEPAPAQKATSIVTEKPPQSSGKPAELPARSRVPSHLRPILQKKNTALMRSARTQEISKIKPKPKPVSRISQASSRMIQRKAHMAGPQINRIPLKQEVQEKPAQAEPSKRIESLSTPVIQAKPEIKNFQADLPAPERLEKQIIQQDTKPELRVAPPGKSETPATTIQNAPLPRIKPLLSARQILNAKRKLSDRRESAVEILKIFRPGATNEGRLGSSSPVEQGTPPSLGAKYNIQRKALDTNLPPRTPNTLQTLSSGRQAEHKPLQIQPPSAGFIPLSRKAEAEIPSSEEGSQSVPRPGLPLQRSQSAQDGKVPSKQSSDAKPPIVSGASAPQPRIPYYGNLRNHLSAAQRIKPEYPVKAKPGIRKEVKQPGIIQRKLKSGDMISQSMPMRKVKEESISFRRPSSSTQASISAKRGAIPIITGRDLFIQRKISDKADSVEPAVPALKQPEPRVEAAPMPLRNLPQPNQAPEAAAQPVPKPAPKPEISPAPQAAPVAAARAEKAPASPKKNLQEIARLVYPEIIRLLKYETERIGRF